MNIPSGTANINGAQITYEEAGPANSTLMPLILVHARLADLRMWDAQFPVFAAHRRTIRYDLRGSGRTKMVPGEFSHPDDLYGLMRHLNIERAVLMGCSVGSQVATDFAVLHPEMTAALVTVSPSLSGVEDEGEPPKYIMEFIGALQSGDLDHAAEYAARVWMDGRRDDLAQVNPAAREKMKAMARLSFESPDGVGTEKETVPPAALRLDVLKMPLLAIVGEQDDPNIMRVADMLVASSPAAKKLVFANTAHFPNMERPEDFNQTVISFLEAQGI